MVKEGVLKSVAVCVGLHYRSNFMFSACIF